MDGASVTSPIFILSCERSGSTLLRYLLDAHPEICSPGELALGRLLQDLQRVVARTIACVAGGDEQERSRLVRLETRKIVDGIMERYAAGRGKRIWCDKTPSNLFALAEIAATFPDARYICLYRQSLDVVHSCLDVSRFGFMYGLAEYVQRSPRNVVAALLESWTEKTGTILRFEADNAGRCFRVHYEALVNDPAATLDGLFAFLGLDWDRTLLDHALTDPHDPGGGDPKIRKTSAIERDRIGHGVHLRERMGSVPVHLTQQVADLHLALGYPL
jgi:protein-tyrosine sulfotransferase